MCELSYLLKYGVDILVGDCAGNEVTVCLACVDPVLLDSGRAHLNSEVLFVANNHKRKIVDIDCIREVVSPLG